MYDSQNIAQRVKIIAKEKGIPVKNMLADIKLGENTLQNMKTSMPKADNLAKIADYLNCSVDFLMGRTEIISINEHIKMKEFKFELNDNDFHSKEINVIKIDNGFKITPITMDLEEELDRLIHNLSIEEKIKVITYLRKMKEEELLNV